MARVRSEFRVYAVRNRLKAELQTQNASLRAALRPDDGACMGYAMKDRLPTRSILLCALLLLNLAPAFILTLRGRGM